jgi:hypothetical protein
VVTTSQPLLLEQATFSLRLLSQWTSWLLLAAAVVVMVAVELVATGLLLELAVEVQVQSQLLVLQFLLTTQ